MNDSFNWNSGALERNDEAGVALEFSSSLKGDPFFRTSEEQLRHLTLRLQTLQEEEYSRIANKIHDAVGHSLTALKLDLCRLEKTIDGTEDGIKVHFDKMKDAIVQTVQEVRRIASDLRPGILDDLGIVEAIEWQTWHFSKRNDIQSIFKTQQDHIELDRRRATALFRIFQEILNNIANHAEASMVWVSIYKKMGHLVLEVRDNGRGIRHGDLGKPRSTGILNIRERALSVKGNVHIFGIPGKGTTTVVNMPNGRLAWEDLEPLDS